MVECLWWSVNGGVLWQSVMWNRGRFRACLTESRCDVDEVKEGGWEWEEEEHGNDGSIAEAKKSHSNQRADDKGEGEGIYITDAEEQGRQGTGTTADGEER